MNIFDTRTMLGMIKKAEFAPTTFLRDRYFSNAVNFDTAKVDIDIVDANGRTLAPFVNPKVGGKVVPRSGYQTNTYEAPELSPYMVTTAEDLLKRLPGEELYSEYSPEQRASLQLGKDLRDLDEIITAREEAMCAEALFTGQVTIKGEGYDKAISYWDAETSTQPKTTLSTLWSATNADVLTDLRTIRREIVKKSGISPTEIVCGADVIDALLTNAKVAEQLNTRRVDLGLIKIDDLPNGVTYYGYFGGLDIYGYESWYKNDEGDDVPYVPADTFLMGSPNVKTVMAYGCCAIVDEINDKISMYAEKRVPTSWSQRMNPTGRIVQIKSRPLPVINQVNGFHVVKAL